MTSYFTSLNASYSSQSIRKTARFFFVGLLLFALVGWSSCSNSTSLNKEKKEKPMADTLSQGQQGWEAIEIMLPNGKRLNAYKNGVEERMIGFLTSDEYKNATEADLQKRWFEFDNLDFEFGSTTNLKRTSEPQLENIIAILDAYQEVKIMIFSFADKEGQENAYTQVSRERAKTTELLLIKKGAGSQLIPIDSINKPRVIYDANSPRSKMAKDRGIAIRFVK